MCEPIAKLNELTCFNALNVVAQKKNQQTCNKTT